MVTGTELAGTLGDRTPGVGRVGERYRLPLERNVERYHPLLDRGGVTPMSIGYCLGVGRLYEERAPSGSDERTQVHLEKVPEERGPWGLSHGTPKNVPGSGYGLWSSYAVVLETESDENERENV